MRHGRQEMSTTERTGPRLTIPEDEENRIVRKAHGELKRGWKRSQYLLSEAVSLYPEKRRSWLVVQNEQLNIS